MNLDEKKDLSRFQIVKKTVRIRSVTQRDPSGVKIRPSGLVLCNTEASDLLLAASQRIFENMHKAAIHWLVNLDTKEVAARLVSLDTVGATPIRKLASGPFGLYMHNVFEEYPTLRPKSTCSVPMTVHKDDVGIFFVFHLNLALTPRRVSRKAASPEPPSSD